MDAVAHITTRIEELKQKIAEIQGEIRDQQARLPIMRAKLDELQSLHTLLSEDEESEEDEEAAEEDADAEEATNGHAIGPTEAIFEFLTRADGSVRPAAIVNGVINEISSTSNDRRRLLFTTIHSLTTRGRLEKTQSGRIRLPKGNDE